MGGYKIAIVDDIASDFGTLHLGFPSGQVFIGAGEDTSGGDLEPDSSDSIQGVIVGFEPGDYLMKYKKTGFVVELAFLATIKKI
jgi:hypothetical protein